MVAAKTRLPSHTLMSQRRQETFMQCKTANRLRYAVKVLIRHCSNIPPVYRKEWSEMIDSTHYNTGNEYKAKRILMNCLESCYIETIFFSKKGTDIEREIPISEFEMVPTWYICILVAYLTNSKTLNWFSSRRQAYEVHKKIKTFV